MCFSESRATLYSTDVLPIMWKLDAPICMYCIVHTLELDPPLLACYYFWIGFPIRRRESLGIHEHRVLKSMTQLHCTTLHNRIESNRIGPVLDDLNARGKAFTTASAQQQWLRDPVRENPCMYRLRS